MKRTGIIAFILCLCISATAQEQPDSSDLYFQHLQLNEIVVTGLAGDTKVKHTPSPISVIRPADLAGRASTNIIQALAAEPGLSAITTGAGIAKPVIRGLGYNRVVVVNDGIRQEGQQWGDEHGIELDGAAVHSVEILKGPASLMYGSDALAGVLIFRGTPVAPMGKVQGHVSAEYQSNNNLFTYSLLAGGNHNGWVWNARFSDKYAQAYRNSINGRVYNSGFRERAASGMFGKNASWGYSRLKFSYYHLTPGIIEGGDEGSLTSLPGLPFQHVRHYKVVSDNTVRIGEGNLKAIVGWQQNRRQEFEESATECGLDLKLNTIHYDIRYQIEFPAEWKAAWGVGGMFQLNKNLGEEYLIPDYRLFDAGVFATASKQWREWTFSGGVRMDFRRLHSFALDGRFEDFSRSFPGFSASLGAVRPLGEHFTVRANIARGFRAPNLSELASNGEHEGTLRYELGNKDLRPEYSLQGDLGLDFESKYVSVHGAFFLSRVSNYIFAVKNGELSDEGLPVYAFVSGLAHLRGGELVLDVHPVHSLHLSSAFSCVFANEKGGEALPLIPAPRLFSEIKYEFTHGGQTFNNAFLALNLDWNMAQSRFYSIDGTETATPAYVLLGASAGTDVVIKGKTRFSVYLIGSNLTDKAYMPHLSRLKEAGVYNMGRNISVKISIPI